MKKIIAIAVFGLINSVVAQAANNVGQCIFPKYEILKNGNMKLKKPIPLYSEPDVKSGSTTLTTLTAFRIAKESNGLIQLVEVPGFDGTNARAGKAIGWAKLANFDFQELRNCN